MILSRFYIKHLQSIHWLLITFCIVAIYWQVYSFEFLIGWDDQWFVTNNYTTGGFTLNNLYHIFTDYYYGQYAPLNQLYYTTLYALFEYNSGYYHLMSLLIHVVNSILVYSFIKKLNKALFITLGNQKNIALLTALLFAILPVNIEPVAWVAASKVQLYAFFYLLALISYLKYIKTQKANFFYLVLLFYALSFGFKEQAVTLPVCMLSLDYFHSRNLNSKIIWLEKIPVFILSILFGFITIDSQEIDEREFYNIFQRVPLALYTISEYITKCILPVNLSYLYPFPFQKNEPIPNWLYIHLFFIPLTIYFLKGLLKVNWILFAISFFIIHILLISNLFSISRFSIIADRYVYISSIGICLSTVCSFFYLKQRVKNSQILQCLAFFYFIFLGYCSFHHLPTWRNTVSLKKDIKKIILQRQDITKRINKKNDI